MSKDDSCKEAKRMFNLYDSNETSKITANDTSSIQQAIKENVTRNLYAYYEYIQFKKATFKCTNVQYDDSVTGSGTGRVIEMDFEFTGNLY